MKFRDMSRVGKVILITLVLLGAIGTAYTFSNAQWSLKLAVVCVFASITTFFRLQIYHGIIDIGGPLIVGCLVSGKFAYEELLLITLCHQAIGPFFLKRPDNKLKAIGNISEGMVTISVAWIVWTILQGSKFSIFSLQGMLASMASLITYVILNIFIINMLIIYVSPRPDFKFFENYRMILNVSLSTVLTQYFYAILFAGIYKELGASVLTIGVALFFVFGLLGMISTRNTIQKASLGEKLRSNEVFLHDLVENLDNGLIALDSQGKIIHINSAAQALVDQTICLGLSVADTSFEQVVSQAQEHVSFECSLNGRLLRVRKTPLSQTDKGKGGDILILEDITEAKVFEDYAMHKDRLTLLGQFSAGIMHEMSKPLTMLSLAYEEISSSAADISSKYLNIFGRSIDDLTDLSQQLLNFSSPRPGRGKTFSNLGQVFSETLEIAGALAKKKQITFLFEEGCDLFIDIDEHELRQVFLNLISNAIDVTPRCGSIRCEVGLGAFHAKTSPIWQKDCLEGRTIRGWFSVEDQGAGFTEQVIARLGDSFVTTKGEGHGLGLSIVLLLLKRWNARMQIFHLSSGGSRVVIEL